MHCSSLSSRRHHLLTNRSRRFKCVSAVVLTSALLGCTVGVAQAATPTRTGSHVVATAMQWRGTPYKWGGNTPGRGLDCSGLVQQAFKRNGRSLPRTASKQARVGTRVPSLASARPGDLVAFGSPAYHIGIYVGNGKMIHAPSTGDVVKVAKVYQTPTTIRRILPAGGSVAKQATSTKTLSAHQKHIIHLKNEATRRKLTASELRTLRAG